MMIGIATNSSVLTMLFIFSLAGYASEAEVKLKKGDRIVFFGDSITAGAGTTNGFISLIKNSVQAAHPDWGLEMINAGQSGNKVADLQARLQVGVLDKKPSIVFIYIGVNDVGHWTARRRVGTTKDKYESGLKEIVGKIKAAAAQVVLCTPSVIGEKTDGTNRNDKMMEEYCAISRRVATETQVFLVDLRTAFKDYLKAHNSENQEKGIFTIDGVHLSPAGNNLVAEQMLKVLGLAVAEVPVAPLKK
jgi:lysophospholipase L1-like esterase